MRAAISDIRKAFCRWRLWKALAAEDVRQTYRRSIVGVLWVALSFSIFVIAKIVIFGSMLGEASNQFYASYLVLGFFVWQFMLQVVTVGPTIFINSENWLRNDPIELPVFAFQALARVSVDFMLTGFISFLAVFILGGYSPQLFFVVALAIPVYLMTAFSCLLVLGVVCTRYRDVNHLIQAIMRVMFFLTPIFWYPESMPDLVSEVLFWNPFAHYISILRTPILYGEFPWESWMFVALFTTTISFFALALLSVARKKLIFWM